MDASYDAACDMTCRAPSNTVTCSGTPTGAVMTYDAERRLATWQNTPSNPTSTAAYWYDGEGHRVAQTFNGTTTYYLGDDEEITGATLLTYDHIPGLPVLGTIVGVTRTYLASDGLGSESVDLSYNGSVLATALYGPYGVGRYATGTMPSSKGYTGQRQDSGSGLDYYNARYYDGAIGQFTSADTLPDVNPIVFDGEPEMAKQLLKGSRPINHYAYVAGGPETATDPTGYRRVLDESSMVDGQDFGPQQWLVGTPDVVAWGTSTNNVAIYRYSGKDLQMLIDLASAREEDLKHGFGAHVNLLISALIGGGIAASGGIVALLAKYGAEATIALTTGSSITGAFVGGSIGLSDSTYVDQLDKYVNSLQDAEAKGETVDFMVATVNGHVTFSTMPNPFTGTVMVNIQGIQNQDVPGFALVEKQPNDPQPLYDFAHAVLQQQLAQCVGEVTLSGGDPTSCG